jgi:cation diffusion facilitator family transporter
MSAEKRYQAVRRVTWVSVITNTLLGIIKTLLGLVGHSHAIFADGLHSFSDLLSDLLVLFAAKFGSQAADHDHPYGHQRIETVATVLVSLLVIGTGVGILIDAVSELLHPHTMIAPKNYLIFVAFFSIIANEALFRYTLWVGNKIESNLLRANAWHSRSDALSSLVVLVGVIGAMLGALWLDNLAALVVGALVIKMGWDLGVSSVQELIDTGLDQDTLLDIEKTIRSVPGVCELHCLRSRSMAGDIYIDVHLLVDPMISVSEGHYISYQAHLALMQQFEKVSDVTVHIDPEDDGQAALCEHLPARDTIMAKLTDRWQGLPHVNDISDIQLHYLKGRLLVNVFIKTKEVDVKTIETLAERYNQAASDLDDVENITLWFG